MIEAYKYAMSHLPLPVHDVLLKHAEVIQFEKRHDASFQSLVFFVEKFTPLKAKLGSSMDQLFDQFTDYQSLQDDSVDDSQRIDQIWHHLGVLQGCDGLHFNLLFEVSNIYCFCHIAMQKNESSQW